MNDPSHEPAPQAAHTVIFSTNGAVVAWERDDTQWECECGEIMGSKEGMFWHRRHTHGHHHD